MCVSDLANEHLPSTTITANRDSKCACHTRLPGTHRRQQSRSLWHVCAAVHELATTACKPARMACAERAHRMLICHAFADNCAFAASLQAPSPAMTAAAAESEPRADEHAGDWLPATLSITRMLLPNLRAQLAAAASHAAKQAACPSSASAVQLGLVGRFKQQLACSHTRGKLGGRAE